MAKKDEPRKEAYPTRRTKAAQDLEHLIPGGRGKHMTDDQLEIWLDCLLRPNK